METRLNYMSVLEVERYEAVTLINPLERVQNEVSEIAQVDQEPEGRQLTMVLSPMQKR